MTVWELRRIMEDSMPWWAPWLLGVGALLALVAGKWLFETYGNRTTDWIERKFKR